MLTAFLSVPNEDKVDIAESFFSTAAEINEDTLLAMVAENADNISEILLDLGLGGSPYKTEKPYVYGAGTVTV